MVLQQRTKLQKGCNVLLRSGRVLLLELDRQEGKTGTVKPPWLPSPNWWKPFKYKLGRPLIDSRDGSIYGALLEWDSLAALMHSRT
ncbi:hypothetical protein U9M48_021892 [Paspalum notatum var. saurae]|uniref:Uncharacterized protein n=1 Tax=Paspalum notatum var. saurae TaxID=547442 RepID=A0AAQ3TIK0_PASNO